MDFKKWLSDKLQKNIGELISLSHNGIVYSLDDKRVLKISHKLDKTPYMFLNKNIKGITKIYHIGKLIVPNRFIETVEIPFEISNNRIPIFLSRIGGGSNEFSYIIMEKVNTDGVSDEIQNISHHLILNGVKADFKSKVMEEYDNLPDLIEYSSILRILYYMSVDKNKSYEILKEFDLPKISYELIDVFHNISKYVNWEDIHLEQFGRNLKGELVAFDIDNGEEGENMKVQTKNMIKESSNSYDSKHIKKLLIKMLIKEIKTHHKTYDQQILLLNDMEDYFKVYDIRGDEDFEKRYSYIIDRGNEEYSSRDGIYLYDNISDILVDSMDVLYTGETEEVGMSYFDFISDLEYDSVSPLNDMFKNIDTIFISSIKDSIKKLLDINIRAAKRINENVDEDDIIKNIRRELYKKISNDYSKFNNLSIDSLISDVYYDIRKVIPNSNFDPKFTYIICEMGDGDFLINPNNVFLYDSTSGKLVNGDDIFILNHKGFGDITYLEFIQQNEYITTKIVDTFYEKEVSDIIKRMYNFKKKNHIKRVNENLDKESNKEIKDFKEIKKFNDPLLKKIIRKDISYMKMYLDSVYDEPTGANLDEYINEFLRGYTMVYDVSNVKMFKHFKYLTMGSNDLSIYDIDVDSIDPTDANGMIVLYKENGSSFTFEEIDIDYPDDIRDGIKQSELVYYYDNIKMYNSVMSNKRNVRKKINESNNYIIKNIKKYFIREFFNYLDEYTFDDGSKMIINIYIFKFDSEEYPYFIIMTDDDMGTENTVYLYRKSDDQVILQNDIDKENDGILDDIYEIIYNSRNFSKDSDYDFNITELVDDIIDNKINMVKKVNESSDGEKYLTVYELSDLSKLKDTHLKSLIKDHIKNSVIYLKDSMIENISEYSNIEDFIGDHIGEEIIVYKVKSEDSYSEKYDYILKYSDIGNFWYEYYDKSKINESYECDIIPDIYDSSDIIVMFHSGLMAWEFLNKKDSVVKKVNEDKIKRFSEYQKLI